MGFAGLKTVKKAHCHSVLFCFRWGLLNYFSFFPWFFWVSFKHGLGVGVECISRYRLHPFHIPNLSIHEPSPGSSTRRPGDSRRERRLPSSSSMSWTPLGKSAPGAASSQVGGKWGVVKASGAAGCGVFFFLIIFFSKEGRKPGGRWISSKIVGDV